MRLYVPILLLLFALALTLRVDLFFTVVWLLVGLYVAARVWSRRSLRHLQIRRRFDGHAFTGDEVAVDLILRNAGRLPIPWLEIAESAPVELRSAPIPAEVVTLRAGEERRVGYTLTCRRRGLYPIGPLRLQTGDVLGMEERDAVWPEPASLTVYPRIVPLQELGLPTASALVTLPAPAALFEDLTRIVGVRDYRPGDSPRRIHWTATARTGRLLVKQYQPAFARETLICLDLDVNGYPLRPFEATEQAIVAAASLANHMVVREGLPVGLAIEARDPLAGDERRVVLPPAAERAQLMSVLEVLARVQTTKGGRFVDLLRRESVRLAWGSTMVLLTGHVDDELAATILNLKRSGYMVAVVLVQPPVAPAGPAAPGQLAGAPVHRVWTDRDLAGWA